MLIFIMALMNLRSIQKTVGQLDILVFLYRNEKVTAKKIKYGIGLNPRTATFALSNLEEIKLVRKLKNDRYKLTRKGRDVAEHLNQVEKLLLK